MKILFLTRRFSPEIGGVEKHVSEISKILNKLGHKIIIVTELPNQLGISKINNYHSIDQSDTYDIISKEAAKSIQTDHFKANKIQVIRLNTGGDDWFKKFRIWAELFEIRKIIINSDVVHCHDVFFWYLPFRPFYKNKKIFTTFHGYESYPLKWKAIVVRKISELLSNGNICVGEFMKKWYYTRPDYVIYGGVSVPLKRKTLNNYKAVFFGRLDSQTGILNYLKAAKLIKKSIPSFDLAVIGEGELAKKIKFPIKSPNPIVSENVFKYRYVFVSRYLSILEAMVARRLVFAAFDNKLKEDYLRMSPFAKFINISGTPVELAKQVKYFYANKGSEQKMINEAFYWAKNQTWEKVVDVYISLWGKSK